MKRRSFVQAIPFLYASPELFAQSIAQIETRGADLAGKPVPGFFSSPQLAALRQLSKIILPAIGSSPGALEAGAAEFLDFLIGESPVPTRTLYQTGLDTLNSRAAARYGTPFSGLDDARIDPLLSPLREPWTWKEPPDSFALFLRHAKADILTATMNSRDWIAAAQRNRGSAGNRTYWLPAE